MKVIHKIRNLQPQADGFHGWTGRRLWIELDQNSCHIEPLSKDYCKTWLGGRGFNAQVLGSQSNNPLCIAAGPLTGTIAPFSGKITISGKSGSEISCKNPFHKQHKLLQMEDGFAAAMKYSGFDQIIISGKATIPTYILIDPDYIEIRDAGPLWGLGSRETCARISYEELDPGIKVLSVGPSGEDGNSMAAIMNSYNSLDNGEGLGSLMGNKKLKAIAFRGSGRLIVADPKRFIREYWRIFDQIHTLASKSGEERGYPLFQSAGITNKNRRQPASGITKKPVSCWACPAECGTVLNKTAQGNYNSHCLESDIEYLKLEAQWAEIYQNSDLIHLVSLTNNLGLDIKGLSNLTESSAENVTAEILRLRIQDKNIKADWTGILDLYQRIKILLSETRNISTLKSLPDKKKKDGVLPGKKLSCMANLLGGCDQAARYPGDGKDVWNGIYKGLFTFATGMQLCQDDINTSVAKVLDLEKQVFKSGK